MKVLPWPSVESTETRPPSRLDELLHQRQADAGALPRPPLVGAAQLPEAVEDEVEVVLGDADAGVADRDLVAGVAPRSRSAMRPARRELQRVREQVEHDALEHVDVDEGLAAEVVELDLEVEAEPLDGGSEVGGDAAHDVGHVGPHPVRLDRTGLDPGEVEDAVDEADEPVGVATDQLEALPRLLAEIRLGEGVLHRPGDEGERGAQLVADVGEEVGLGRVELGQHLGPVPLVLEAAQPAQRHGDVGGAQLAHTPAAARPTADGGSR